LNRPEGREEALSGQHSGDLPEPWLRGPLPQVHAILAPILCALQQTREDLARHTAGLTVSQVWARPHGLAPLGFHLRHIAGSVDRLTVYLEGRQLEAAQMAALAAEMEPGANLEELLADVEGALRRTEQVVRAINPATFAEPRWVGRKRLPTTVMGLLVHIAEHTQRHVGQAIGAAQLARA
jgi:hypothetical protein